jgi:hypothetical protein
MADESSPMNVTLSCADIKLRIATSTAVPRSAAALVPLAPSNKAHSASFGRDEGDISLIIG